MIIEKKDEKADGVELWTVTPGSVVELDDSDSYWLVTDNCTVDSVSGLCVRQFVPAERDYFIAIVDLVDGEFCWYLGSTGAAVVEAKVVIE